MIPYTNEDYKKYVYAKGRHRLWRIEEAVEALDPACDTNGEAIDDLQMELVEARIWLWRAAFTADDEAEADDEREAAWARAGVDPQTAEARRAAGIYSDGRPGHHHLPLGEGEGDYVTHIWHPDPLHPRNRAGEMLQFCEGPYPWRHRRMIITAPGVLDVVDEDALLLGDIDEDGIEGVFDDK